MAKKKKQTKKNSSELGYPVIPLKLDDEIRFQCSCCGDCCRNVEQSVMLESLDIFNIARHFKQAGDPNWQIEDVLTEYATPMFLTDFGYPIFLLNTVGSKHECIFLKSGKCSINSAKPRTCRTYPLSVVPADKKGNFEYCYVSKYQRHVTGDKRLVSDWIDQNMSIEDKDFITEEYTTAFEIGSIMRKLLEKGMNIERILFVLMFHKYYDFDVDTPFMPQYTGNIEKLKRALTDLLTES